jgi:hypothetical protein
MKHKSLQLIYRLETSYSYFPCCVHVGFKTTDYSVTQLKTSVKELLQMNVELGILSNAMKEPLVSELTIPHASPLYHTGNNIFMKYN